MKKIKYDDLCSPFVCSQTYPSDIFSKYIDNGFFPKVSRNLTFAPHTSPALLGMGTKVADGHFQDYSVQKICCRDIMHVANNCTSVLEQHDPSCDTINYGSVKQFGRLKRGDLEASAETQGHIAGGRYIVATRRSSPMPACILLHVQSDTRAQRESTVFPPQ